MPIVPILIAGPNRSGDDGDAPRHDSLRIGMPARPLTTDSDMPVVEDGIPVPVAPAVLLGDARSAALSDTILRDGEARDTDRMVYIWRAAVEATHHFLTAPDIDDYERRLITDFLPSVRLVVAERGSTVVGFSGTSGPRLEMLFVDPHHHGVGVGSALLDHAVSQGVSEVDVNEQNPNAVAFYRRRAFEVVGRSPLDADDRAFPILHLRRPTP